MFRSKIFPDLTVYTWTFSHEGCINKQDGPSPGPTVLHAYWNLNQPQGLISNQDYSTATTLQLDTSELYSNASQLYTCKRFQQILGIIKREYDINVNNIEQFSTCKIPTLLPLHRF